MDLIDVCFIFSKGSIYDVGIVFHITISIQWKVPFPIRPDVIIAEKAKIVAFRIKKVPVLREEDRGVLLFLIYMCFYPIF